VQALNRKKCVFEPNLAFNITFLPKKVYWNQRLKTKQVRFCQHPSLVLFKWPFTFPETTILSTLKMETACSSFRFFTSFKEVWIQATLILFDVWLLMVLTILQAKAIVITNCPNLGLHGIRGPYFWGTYPPQIVRET